MKFRSHDLDLSEPKIMGILNVTPDSFSDGGQFHSIGHALRQAETMLQSGADMIDIGGESTRPGADFVSADEELSRVIPIIEAVHREFQCLISIDTSKPQVMHESIAAGACLINDVRALQEEGALEAAAKLNVPVCLMHMQGQPKTMQDAPAYQDIQSEVIAFFEERISACFKAGIPNSNLILDPGFGFGKTLSHNYELLGKLSNFSRLKYPILVGLSRKSMIGSLLQVDVNERLIGSVAGALLAAQQGAQILRVHDVKETKQALAVWRATKYGVDQ